MPSPLARMWIDVDTGEAAGTQPILPQPCNHLSRTLLQVPQSDKSLTYKLIKTLLVNEKEVGETC